MFKLCLLLLMSTVLMFSQNRDKVIVVGTGFYPPFEFYDESGKLVGYDIELGDKIAEKLGKKFVWKQLHFTELFTALESGEIDLIIGAIHITAEREEKYLFSSPYVNTGLVIVSKKNKGRQYDKLEDFRNKKIGVKSKSTGETFCLQNKEKYNFKLQSFTETELSFDALKSSKLDGVMSDYLSSRLYVKENPELVISTPPFNSCGIGIVALKNKKDVIIKINKIIEDLTSSGFLKSLYIKWLL